MSKAFTREDDATETNTLVPPARSPLPPGVKNYITPGGESRLRKSLGDLLEKRRMAGSASPAGIAPQATADLRKLDARIRQMEEILGSVAVTGPPPTGREQIRFGAKVAVEGQGGEKDVYQIVGVDETDLEKGLISWRSPLARALHLRRTGEVVRFPTPAGSRELKILSIQYDD